METKTTVEYMQDKEGQPYAEIRVWGVTQSRHSCVLLVKDFNPYFLVDVAPGVTDAMLLKELDKYLRTNYPEDSHVKFIVGTEHVERRSISGYRPPGQGIMNLLKITLCSPKYVSKARDAIEDGVITCGLRCRTYEANVLFGMRFMVDIGLSGCQWVRVPRHAYTMTHELTEDGLPKYLTSLTFCCLNYRAIQPVSFSDPIGGSIGPWRWLSYDIEACRFTPGFPKAEVDPVTQVCFVLEEHGRGIISKRAFCLAPEGGSCNPIFGVELSVYPMTEDGERHMMRDIRQYILETDFDFITGWNVDKFDNPYVFRDRARTLDIKELMTSIGRVREKLTYIRNKTIKSRAYGTIKTTEMVCEGRTCYDGYMHTRLRERLPVRSYTLNNVSNYVLQESKVDVPHWQIPILQKGSNADRHRLTYYCMVDAELPLKILHKRMAMENGAEQARVTGVDFAALLGGEGKKTFCKLLRTLPSFGMTIPSSLPSQNDEETTGGHVFPPDFGYYVLRPVVTADFKSLYPSIMEAYNVGYDSYCSLAWARANLKPTDYNVPPYIENPTYCFVRPHIHMSIMAQIVHDLLAARAQAKLELKLEKDPEKKKVLDARQLALKLLCNSVYGFFKAHYLCNKDCMEAVTAWGRYMIELTRDVICQHFTPEQTRRTYEGAPKAMELVFQYMKDHYNGDPSIERPGEDNRSNEEGFQYEGYSRWDLENVQWWRPLMMLHFKEDIVDEPAKLIYGDSVTPDTPCLLIDTRTGDHFIDTIDNLIDTSMGWWTRGDGKEVGTAPPHVKVWTEKGWTSITQIIRHRTDKRIYRVLTHTGVVDVTEDHSLLDSKAEKISAVECAVHDTELLHSYPILFNGVQPSEASVIKVVSDKVEASKVYYQMRAQGYQVSIDVDSSSGLYHLVGAQTPVTDPFVIKKIEDITHLYAGGYVYDLETENHHFQAGVGQMIVHNTDSVMISFGVMSVERAWYLGERASFMATAHFEHPNELECEAVKQPSIFIKKKGYIVREREWATHKGKIKVQGETAKRRDNFPLVAELQGKCAELLLRDASDGGPDVLQAIELVHQTCRDLLLCKVDISKLVMSQTFSKTLEEYEEGGTHPAHVELWKKKRARAHITGEYLESTGDRVPYVVMPEVNTGSKKAKKWERVEDPEYCMRNGLYPDPLWYIEQLKKPLLRLFCPVFTGDLSEWVGSEIRNDPLIAKLFVQRQTTMGGDFVRTQERVTQDVANSDSKLRKLVAHKVLFEGPHMRVRKHRSIRMERAVQEDSGKRKTSLSTFVTKGVRCLSCQVVMRNGAGAVCRDCMPKQATVYQELMQKYDLKQRLYNAAWTRCQRCQGSLHTNVVCGNRDCDNFYRRIAYQVDIEDLVEQLNRFT